MPPAGLPSSFLAHAGGVTWDEWLYVFSPLAFYAAVVILLVDFGKSGGERNIVKVFFRRISNSLERVTGYPGWSMAGVLSGLLVLGVAVVGLYWDVAWHIDNGRDKELFTPSHTMIVIGLAGLVYSAIVAVIFASLDRAPVGLRVRGIRIPWSALALALLGAGGVASFPLDALWHEAYGVDVTLWSPTHLGLLAGGSFATIALWLMTVEGASEAQPTRLGRAIHVLVAGATLTGMSTFQGEFDFGVPQFQAVYLPVLIMVAAGFTLVAARVALGPGGALKAVFAFLILRGTVALIVAGALNHTVPRFPLYLAAALGVEAVALVRGTEQRARFAVASGLTVATLGLAGELVWAELSGWYHPTSNLWPKVALLAPVTAVGAAVLGAALSQAFAPGSRLHPGLLAGAGVAVVLALVYPLPRNVGDVEAVIRLQPVGDRAHVEVQLVPPDAARQATVFGVSSHQGGGRVAAELEPLGAGRYRSSRPVPVTGSWKAVVGLQRGDEVMAAPIYLPADPEIGAPAVPALPERRAAFVRNTTLLLRETHPGPAWPSVVAYSALGLVSAGWVALFALAVVRLRGRGPDGEGPVRAVAGTGALVPSR